MDAMWSKDITIEVQDMCESLEKRYYETAVIIIDKEEGKTLTFGSSVGAAFLLNNPIVANMFYDFYEMHKNGKDSGDNPESHSTKIGFSDAETILQRCDDGLEEDCSSTAESNDFGEVNFEGDLSEQKSYNNHKEQRNETAVLEIKMTSRQSSRKKMSVKIKEKKKKGNISKAETSEIKLNDSSNIVSKSKQNKNIDDIKHTEIIDKVKPAYGCNKCDKSFKSKAGLTAHELYIHLKSKEDTHFSMPEHRDRNVKLQYINKDGNKILGLRCSMYEKQIDKGNTNYRCNICSYVTERYNGMLEHSQTHVISDLFSCTLCDKTFKVKKSLWRHTNQHRKFPHMCKTCLRMYETKEELEEHENSHELSHVCDICNRTYDSIGRLNYHKKISHGPKQNTCEICGSSFTCQSLLRQHKKRHGPKQFFCDKCSCSYYFMHQLTNHLKVHDENSIKYKCTVCPREYTNKSHWKEHVKLHDGSNFVKCDLCDKSYNSRKSLNLHKNSTHVTERKFICQVCGKAFLTKHHLKNHLITHDDKRDYKCRFCCATFKKNDVLKMHENVHTKERKYICDICGGHFLRRSSLRNHRLTHVPGHQRWKCRYCDTKFRTQSSMMTHIKNKHADFDLSHDRPLCERCEQCGKVFAKGLAFRIHSDMHAGVKRHKCRFCGNAFTDPANLRVHLKIHDGTAKRYACDICDSRFSSVKQYTEHRAKHDKPTEQESQKCTTGLDLSQMQIKSTEEVNNRNNPSVTMFESEETSRADAAATLHAMGDATASLVPFNTSHAFLGTGNGIMNNSSLVNSSMMTPILYNENTDTGLISSRNKKVNVGLDGQLRQDIDTDNLTSTPDSAKQGTDMKSYVNQPNYSAVFRSYCSQ